MSIFTSSILIPSVDLLLLCAAVRTVWTKTDQSVGILVLWSPPPQYHARLCFGPKSDIILTSGFADITVNWLQTPGSERLSQWPQIEMYFYTYTSFNPSRISVSTSTWLKKNKNIFFSCVSRPSRPRSKVKPESFCLRLGSFPRLRKKGHGLTKWLMVAVRGQNITHSVINTHNTFFSYVIWHSR